MTTHTADRESPVSLFRAQPKPRLYDRLVEALCTGVTAAALRRPTSTGFAASFSGQDRFYPGQPIGVGPRLDGQDKTSAHPTTHL